MNLRINSDEANFRVTPNTSKAPLARLPAGHLVIATSAEAGNWQPCRTTIDGDTLDGFVHNSLLRPEINPEVDRLIEFAGIEFKKFLFGTRHETHPDSRKRIADYWKALPHAVEPVSVAWSAVFISFIVRQATLAKSFKFAQRHTTYMSDSKNAKLAGDASRAYWAVKLSERKLQIGDMVGAYRTGPGCGSAVKTYNSLPGDFCSHCDVVVSIRGNEALTIGGNVGNTVKVTKVPLTATGRVEEGKKRITVMARNF